MENVNKSRRSHQTTSTAGSDVDLGGESREGGMVRGPIRNKKERRQEKEKERNLECNKLNSHLSLDELRWTVHRRRIEKVRGRENWLVQLKRRKEDSEA